MANQAANQPIEANMPEKPAPVQIHHAPQTQNRFETHPLQIHAKDLPKPEPFRPSKPFSVAKLVFASFNFIFAIMVLGLSIGILGVALFDVISVIIAGVLAIVSILWQVADYLTICLRRSIYRPIHPGAHVGMHLVLWILALIVTLFFCFTLTWALNDWTVVSGCGNGSSGGYYASSSDGSDYVYCDYYNFSSVARAHLYFGIVEALTAGSVLMLVCHFALFAMACIETDHRRKWAERVRVVYVVADGQYQQQPMYYREQAQPQPQPPRSSMAVQQGQTAGGPGPSPEMYGYFAPTTGGGAAAAAPTGESKHVPETRNPGPSGGSYA